MTFYVFWVAVRVFSNTGKQLCNYYGIVAENLVKYVPPENFFGIEILQNSISRCVNFRRHAPQIGYHDSNVSWVSRRNRNLLLWNQLIPLYLLKVRLRSMKVLGWKQSKRAYFCVWASVHPMQTGHNISRIYCTKVKKNYKTYRFCDLSNRCEMPAQTIRAVNANLMSPSCATKLLAMAMSLDRSSPAF